MKLIFFDESGYSKSWKEDIEAQPFYVLAGFLVEADVYIDASENLRRKVNEIGLEKLEHPLGLGFEIKAHEIAKGKGWWKHHNDERNAFIPPRVQWHNLPRSHRQKEARIEIRISRSAT